MKSSKQHGKDRMDYSRRALMVSLGVFYYMRLDNTFREDYAGIMDKKTRLPHEADFSTSLEDELNWFCDSVELPPGIARTRALKENIFATIVVYRDAHAPHHRGGSR